ncbi:MAG TPA: NapC/NirT family cytochrome c [Thermoanaerobaculia bacterium]|nr:NapC/NirT family cytochrome c [Thermoanaerobaculia bacterium]
MTDVPKRPSLTRNLVSQAGLVIIVVALANLLFLIYVNATQSHPNPYMGILTWLVAPAILIFGIALFIAGMLLERRRRRRLAPDEIPQFPTIDLNDNRTRLTVVGSTVAIILFVTMTVFGSYQVYHYTDSDAFCGTLCHQVMRPEYTAYSLSPHARVGCVGCHVGAGATWYVRSKLSGAYQVYATIANKYPRPIPSPVANLRPAQETCEQCHWPEKFWGAQLKVFDHYQYDETNTPVEVRMLINTGGGNPQGGQMSGIHWHMNIANEITYIATDEHRQKIAWVRMRNRRTGAAVEYMAQDAKLTDAQIATAPKRVMDCVDCHNRPTHIYVSPDRAVDKAILTGRIDRSLPFVKQQAVAALVKDYKTTPEGERGVANDLIAYYQKTYPAIYQSKKGAVDRAASALTEIFATTRFPEMRVDWRTHPDNIGHMQTIGCFRCHDDQHVSKDGKKISKECNVCHTVLAAGNISAPFNHPVDIGDLKSVNCADCHNGGGM